MSTFTDTSVRISLATPEDLRDLSQKSLHLWVGATSPLWAPFWAAASFGVGAWALGQGAARVLGGTLYDKDLPLALKWPGFESLPRPVETLKPVVEKAAEVREEVVAATMQAVEETTAIASEAVTNTVESVAAAQAEAAPIVEDVVKAPVAAAKTVEAATEATTAAVTATTKTSAALAKKAAEATLDLLGSQAPAKPATSAPDTRPLIDPVTAAPVIPAVVEAFAEPKPPLPKPVPRRPRKS